MNPSDIKDALMTLHSLSDDNLHKFLNDEDFFDNYVDVIKKLPQFSNWESEKERLIANNKAMAESNLQFEPKLQEGKQALMDLYEKARTKSDELESKRGLLESMSSNTSLDTTHALMQASLAEAEEASENMAEKFMDGEMDLDSFLSQFQQTRVTAHLRRLKSEKLGEIINSQMARPSYSVPYPTNNPQMMPLPPM